MSKIALISKKLGPQTLALAQALKGQLHEITLITSQNEVPPIGWSEPVLSYFKKWNLFEAVRFFPSLVKSDSEIFHFVIDDNEPITNGQILLAQMIRAIPYKINVSSFFYHNNQEGLITQQRLNLFIKSQDAVTFANQERLMWHRRKLNLTKQVTSEIFQPLLSYDFLNPHSANKESKQIQETNTESNEELLQICKKLKPFVVVPTTETDFLNQIPDFPFAHFPFRFVFWGPRKKIEHLHYFCLGDLTEAEKMLTIEKSQGVLLAFSDFSTTELQKFLECSAITGRPLLIRPQQLRLAPGLVRNNKTGYILERGLASLEQIARTNPTLSVPERVQSEDLTQWMDNGLNELNRLYNKAFSNRWS
jgi:hypothetical protein